MKKVLCSILPILSIALLVATVAGSAFAQNNQPLPTVSQSDFTTNYFSNNTTKGAPDATLRYTSHYGAILNSPAYGAKPLCANIYVFAADQQEASCCSCPITPNGLVTASVQGLTGNPLTGIIPADGVVQIISTVNYGTCDATFGYLTGARPSPTIAGIDAWMTHIQNKITGPTLQAAYPETETESTQELLTSGELDDLAVGCAFVQELGSGQGDCTKACGLEK